MNLEEFYKAINDSNTISASNRFKNLHLSEMSICGFKYRYAYDNKLIIPFKWEFEIGNAFEFLIYQKIRKFIPNVISQYEIKCKLSVNGNKYNIIGHTDIVDLNSRIVYELKSSRSDNYTDIYERQLFSYIVYGNFTKGYLWKYNFISAKFTETEYLYNDVIDKGIENLQKNLIAFDENRYIEGIENSLCKFCENVNCPMNKKVIL